MQESQRQCPSQTEHGDAIAFPPLATPPPSPLLPLMLLLPPLACSFQNAFCLNREKEGTRRLQRDRDQQQPLQHCLMMTPQQSSCDRGGCGVCHSACSVQAVTRQAHACWFCQAGWLPLHAWLPPLGDPVVPGTCMATRFAVTSNCLFACIHTHDTRHNT